MRLFQIVLLGIHVWYCSSTKAKRDLKIWPEDKLSSVDWSAKKLRVMQQIVHNDGDLAKVPEEFRSDPEIVWMAVIQQVVYLKSKKLKVVLLNATNLRVVPIFVLSAVHQYRAAFASVSKHIPNNDIFLLSSIKENPALSCLMPQELMNDFDFVVKACRISGQSLRYASRILRDDARIVLTSIMQDGIALKYASRRLSNEKFFVLVATARNRIAQFYAASYHLQEDKFLLYLATRLGTTLTLIENQRKISLCWGLQRKLFKQRHLLQNIAQFSVLSLLDCYQNNRLKSQLCGRTSKSFRTINEKYQNKSLFRRIACSIKKLFTPVYEGPEYEKFRLYNKI